jgi:cell division protease FtsH
MARDPQDAAPNARKSISARKTIALAPRSPAKARGATAMTLFPAKGRAKNPAKEPAKYPVGPLERAVRSKEAKSWAALRRRLRVGTDSAMPHVWAKDKSREYIDLGVEPPGDDDDALMPADGPPGAYDVAAKLTLARAIDRCKGLAASIRTGAPVVAFEVADPLALDLIDTCWKDVIFGGAPAKIVSADALTKDSASPEARIRAVGLVVKEAPKARVAEARQRAALVALASARPVVAFTPFAETHLPDAILRAGLTRVSVGNPDPHTIRETIAIVVGDTTDDVLEPELAARIGLVEIAIAVRFDRSAAECMARLRRLASAKIRNADSRDLTLDELHGMPDAIAWAKAFVRDIESFRRGEIPWSSVDAGVVFDGPTGVGKTTLVRSIACAAKCELFATGHARWQSHDEGHLGHFLRKMAADFAEARRRSQAGPVIYFVDEIDSFADRASLTHSYRDYSIAATNGFIFFCDGLSGGDEGLADARNYERPKIVLIGATNDVSRCDPAILRAGRFNRVIRIDLPDSAALEKMLRVRLRNDLADADLSEVALMATGSTGADIERVVKDARRLARQDGSEFVLDHLKRAFGGGHELSAERRARIAGHEAAHILVDVLLNGPENAIATMTSVGARLAGAFRLKDNDKQGTFDDHFRRLQVLLAGRVGETEMFGAPGDGGGGAFGSDLQQATTEACAMAASFGLAGPPIYLGPAGGTERLLAYPEIRTAVVNLLTRAEESCTRLIARNRGALGEIAARLLADGRIDGHAVAKIVASGVTAFATVAGGCGESATETSKDSK